MLSSVQNEMTGNRYRSDCELNELEGRDGSSRQTVRSAENTVVEFGRLKGVVEGDVEVEEVRR